METGTFTIKSNEDQKKITFAGNYVTKPSINLTSNKNINLYLHEVTNSYFICRIDNFDNEQIIVYYAISEIT